MKSLVISKCLHSKWSVYLFFALVCFIVYSPVLRNDFLYQWDDQWMVINKYTEGGWSFDNLWHIFTDFYGGQYGPFTELNYLIIYTFFGYDPFYFHLASLLWHIWCVCFVWRFILTLLRMHGGMEEKNIRQIAFITTLLFAIHPMNVEPVAWISAVKVLIYAFFYLLGLLYYLQYIKSQKFRYYLFTIACFIASFLGKEQAVTFPLALLIVDWFTNRNMKSFTVWNEKMVFFVMAFFFGLITILSQGASGLGITYPFYQRVIFGCFAIIEYITKGLIPIKLNYLYPFPIVIGEELPLRFYIYPILIIFLSVWGWACRKNKFLLFSIFLFIVNLLFSIHIISMARHSIIADRYLYLSYIGIASLIGYRILYIKQKVKYYKSILFILFIYIILLSTYTFCYTKQWKDSTVVREYTKEILDRRLNQNGIN